MLNDKRGFILFIVLSTVLIVAMLAGVILSMISSQSRLTHHQVSRIQAYYAAKAGMNLAFERLRTGTIDNFSLCKSGCTYNDADIPYRVDVTIGALGSGISGTRQIDIRATYTYSP